LSLLSDLVYALIEEEKTGYVHKNTMLKIASYIVSHPIAELKHDSNYAYACAILAKYRVYKLTATFRQSAEMNIKKERLRPYKFRCGRCGLAITAKDRSRHTCK
jgi:hypothetical protein